MDFAGPFLGHMFFVAIDAHSKWPAEVIVMTSTTPEKTIEALRSVLPTMCCQYSWYQTTGPNSLQVSFCSSRKETALSIC